MKPLPLVWRKKWLVGQSPALQAEQFLLVSVTSHRHVLCIRYPRDLPWSRDLASWRKSRNPPKSFAEESSVPYIFPWTWVHSRLSWGWLRKIFDHLLCISLRRNGDAFIQGNFPESLVMAGNGVVEINSYDHCKDLFLPSGIRGSRKKAIDRHGKWWTLRM